MIKIQLTLSEEDYFEFRDMLEAVMNDPFHILNDGIAEKIAKMIEDEKKWEN